MENLILASSSPFRRELLARLKIPFHCDAPEIDETRHAGEPPDSLALRLAEEKSRALAQKYPNALIIGSDQVATANGKIYGKPKTLENAVLQLQELSGATAHFLTALALFNTQSKNLQSQVVATHVQFRKLTESEIQKYLENEPDAVLCAGAAKSESLGITLLESISSPDPTALIGLPLIALCQMLRTEKVL